MLRTVSEIACCPCCGRPSRHVHSQYQRTVRDLPLQDRQAVLRLTVSKFFCHQPDCQRKVFCERLPDLAGRHAQSTDPLKGAHRAIAFELGGEAGSRLASELHMPTSADTLLRRILEVPLEPCPTPDVLGVDDWAIRKGHHYGTILVDLRRNKVIDLLPGRDGESLRTWLKEHPGVEVISRDRASAYSSAASEAAPDAKQVADRWHLLKNVREMLDRFLERHRDKLLVVADQLAPPTAEPEPMTIEFGHGSNACNREGCHGCVSRVAEVTLPSMVAPTHG